jgi:hypothetical protein
MPPHFRAPDQTKDMPYNTFVPFRDAPIAGFEPEVEHEMRMRAVMSNPRFHARITFTRLVQPDVADAVTPIFRATMGTGARLNFEFPPPPARTGASLNFHFPAPRTRTVTTSCDSCDETLVYTGSGSVPLRHLACEIKNPLFL